MRQKAHERLFVDMGVQSRTNVRAVSSHGSITGSVGLGLCILQGHHSPGTVHGPWDNPSEIICA